jgi:hypothetical protein
MHFIGINIFYYLYINYLGNYMIEEKIMSSLAYDAAASPLYVTKCC